jgi:beta-galactosidase/beta-glucuronidase
MKRDNWINLNGNWDFEVNYQSQGQIRVPFCPESKLSCIGQHYEEGSLLCYRRKFSLPEGFNRGRVILHIGAADQQASVFVNGKPVGRHDGGYDAFSIDITERVIEPLCRSGL